MTGNKKNNERWINYIKDILDGSNEHLFSEKENAKTFKYVIGCLETLTSGAALSEKQSNLLIKNIKLRLPGKGNFEWDGPIMLTKKQRIDAKDREDMKGYNRALMQKKIATGIIVGDIREVLEDMGYDLDILSQLREHIKSFVPKPVEEIEEPIMINNPVQQEYTQLTGPSADELLGKFGFKSESQKVTEVTFLDMSSKK